jgi:hypothetical protein
MSDSSTERPRIMVCPVCRPTENYYGRIVFPGEEAEPICPNHTNEEDIHPLLVEVESPVVGGPRR